MALNNRRVEGSFSQGWPIAIFITALAVGSFVTAGVIHKRIFRSPTDVSASYRKEGKPEGADTSAHKAAH